MSTVIAVLHVFHLVAWAVLFYSKGLILRALGAACLVGFFGAGLLFPQLRIFAPSEALLRGPARGFRAAAFSVLDKLKILQHEIIRVDEEEKDLVAGFLSLVFRSSFWWVSLALLFKLSDREKVTSSSPGGVLYFVLSATKVMMICNLYYFLGYLLNGPKPNRARRITWDSAAFGMKILVVFACLDVCLMHGAFCVLVGKTAIEWLSLVDITVATVVPAFTIQCTGTNKFVIAYLRCCGVASVRGANGTAVVVNGDVNVRLANEAPADVNDDGSVRGGGADEPPEGSVNSVAGNANK